MTRRPLSGMTLPALTLILAVTLAMPAHAAENEQLDGVSDEETPERSETGTHLHATLNSGYHFTTPIDHAASAAPYTRLKSGMGGVMSLGTIGSDLKLLIDAAVLDEDDYHAGLYLDYRGRLRLNFLRQSLWHNLLPEQLAPGEPNVYAARDLATPDTRYGVNSTITQADSRFRLGNHPFHLNIGYWQLDRAGVEQLRFNDHYFGDPQSSILSAARKVDSTAREGSVGLDGYFGFFGLSYGFRVRDFVNSAPVERYTFASSGSGALAVGNQAHDVIPDSRVTVHTVKLYTDLSGGLVGSAAYTLTSRENRSDAGDTRPSRRPADTLHLVSGDLSYTPFRELAFALKYRRQQIDRESPDAVVSPFSSIPAGIVPGVYTATPGVLLVRPSSETVRDTVSFSGTYRPTRNATMQLEYRAELESRNNLADSLAPGDPAALHSDRRQTHTGKASLSWRPFSGARMNASYSYAACDNPAYDASFSGLHTGQLFLTYAANGTWGTTASYLARFESGESRSAQPVVSQALSRDTRNHSANASIWFSPLERLTLTASYAYQQADTDQAVLFTSMTAGSLAATTYRSAAHVYGVDAVYAVSDTLDLSLGFQQVLSTSRFLVPDANFSDPVAGTQYTTAGISGMTSLDSTETGVSARGDWRFSKHFGCALDYRFRRYDAGNPLFDGEVHTTLLSLTAAW